MSSADDAFVELAIRRELWIGHGHGPALYGDDGEMQCYACLPTWDYRRAPLAEVTHAALVALGGGEKEDPLADAIRHTLELRQASSSGVDPTAEPGGMVAQDGKPFIATLQASDPELAARFAVLYEAETARS